MNNRERFEKVCLATSRHTTATFSTSFSFGIRALDKRLHDPIHAIYGFVRFADEIVDTLHDFDRKELLDRFKRDTHQAIAEGISLNPILQSFQQAVHRYEVDVELIDTFFRSMEMDLDRMQHDERSFKEYVLGSAEVVGLMCLKIFCEGDRKLYDELKAPAMSLGAAFQKVNFLRDLREDNTTLGRAYFPGTVPRQLNEEQKDGIERDIESDFRHALEGIKRLPRCARMGVHLAYLYYRALFEKIQRTPASSILHQRIRVRNRYKLQLLLGTYVQHRLNRIG